MFKAKAVKFLNLPFLDKINFLTVNLEFFILGFVGTCLFYSKCLLKGIYVGKRNKCYGKIDLIRGFNSRITIGSNVSIVSSSRRCSSSSLFAPTKLRTFPGEARIIIEDNVGLNGTSITARTKTIYVGPGTMIAPNVQIMDSDFHVLWPPEKRHCEPGLEDDQDVIIGKNVWIGSRAIILKGSNIGDNTIIAAGSVVNRIIPANTLAGGVPAKVLKYLG